MIDYNYAIQPSYLSFLPTIEILHTLLLFRLKLSLVTMDPLTGSQFYQPFGAKVPFRCQFHQHFTSSVFVRKSFEQLFCSYGLGLYFVGARILAQKLLVKCWQKCHSVSPAELHPTLLLHRTRSYAQLLQCMLCTVHQRDQHKSTGRKAAHKILVILNPRI